jgi:farnesol dehydrogenase
MKIFITGATGFIGANLANYLAGTGAVIHALYRSEEKTKVLGKENVRLFKGDILDDKSIEQAMFGCDQVYHVAAFTDVWARDKKVIYDLNVIGTKNVLNKALKIGIKDIVFTSTAGVFGPSIKEVVNENTKPGLPYFLEYERTKSIAEEVVHDYIRKGLNIRIVNPTRVYGPGVLSKSNSVTKMIVSYTKGNWHLMPGNGGSSGNYVFIDDVIHGHVLAMEKGKVGERYLLAGENTDYVNFFSTLKRISGKSTWMLKMPLGLMLIVSRCLLFLAKLFRFKPFITPALVKKFYHNWEVSPQKSINELNYEVTPLSSGMEKTLKWLQNN